MSGLQHRYPRFCRGEMIKKKKPTLWVGEVQGQNKKVRVQAGYAFGRYARLPLTSKLDALCAAYVNRLPLHLRFAKLSSNLRLCSSKEKKKDTTRVSFIFWRCRPDLNRRITVLQTGALPLGYCTKFLIALIL